MRGTGAVPFSPSPLSVTLTRSASWPRSGKRKGEKGKYGGIRRMGREDCLSNTQLWLESQGAIASTRAGRASFHLVAVSPDVHAPMCEAITRLYHAYTT